MAHFDRILATTHTLAEKNFTDATTEHRPFLGMIQAKGNMKFGMSGVSPQWNVKFKNLPLTGYSDAEQLEWERSSQYRNSVLEWRGYRMTDVITEFEQLVNSGEQRLIDVYGEKSDEMLRDFKNRFPTELLQVDGSASGNGKKFHGLPSIFGDDGTATNADELINPSDTYGGLSTVLGTYGGSSAADSEYDFWSPTLVNSGYSSSSWAASADARVRTAIQELTQANNDEDVPDIVLCTKTAYRQFINLIDGKEQIFRQSPSDSIAARVGFKRLIEFDGCDVAWSNDVPSSAIGNATTFDAYVLNFDYLELWFLHDQMVKAGSQFDPDQLAWKFWISLYGNMFIRSPRHQGIIQDYA